MSHEMGLISKFEFNRGVYLPLLVPVARLTVTLVEYLPWRTLIVVKE